MRSVVRGRIVTLADSVSATTSVLIEDGVVAALDVGEAQADVATQLSFGDRVVMPALVDPHAHLEVSARGLGSMVDVRVPRCRSIDDVLQALSDGLQRNLHDGGWLRAQANLFFNQKLAEGRYPTRRELDSVSSTVPIVIHAGGHTSLLNTRAMELADLDRFAGNTKGAMGSAVLETENGEPTGVVSEVDALLPIQDPKSLDLGRILADGAEALFTRFGVTVVGDISGSIEGQREIASLVEAGRIPQRIESFVCAPGTLDFEDALSSESWLPAGATRIRQHGVKVFADGGYSAKNAAVHTPYQPPHALEPGSRGRLNLEGDELADLMRRTGEAGLQLAVHANGERAQDTVVQAALNVADSLSGQSPPVRAEHAGNLLTRPEALEGWRQAGIVPVPQPVFLYNFGDFFPVYLGEPAAVGRFPFRRLLDEGFAIAGSSDVYTGAEDRQTNPFFGVWCSLKRETFLGAVIEPDQAITLDEAITMHTVHAARALDLEDTYGTIEPGKAADMIVLDRDPWQCSVDELLDIRVDHVLVDGQIVYSQPDAEPPVVRRGAS